MKYVGSYSDLEKGRYPLEVFLSAQSKMQYIAESLIDIGIDYELISTAFIKDTGQLKRKLYYKPKEYVSNKGVKWKTAPSLGSNTKVAIYFSCRVMELWLFFELLKCHKNEKVILYHIPRLYYPVKLAKMLKGFSLILEVEEIYSKVYGLKKRHAAWETKLLKLADKYIVVSDIIKDYIKDNEAVVVYGAYDVKKDLINKNDTTSDKVHLLYSGYIDNLKKGALRSVKTMHYLPDNFILHITGYGEEDAIREMIDEINIINKSSKFQRCFYHGTLETDDYQEIIDLCCIAFNVQTIGEYTSMELPSKVLKYLSNNLRVVSTKSNSLLESSLSDIIIFTDSDRPEDIALTVQNIDLNNSYNSYERVKYLDNEFKNNLNSLINEHLS